MLSNAYFLAKFRFDTAENEPAKNLQNFRKMHFRKMHFRQDHRRVAAGRGEVERPPAGGVGAVEVGVQLLRDVLLASVESI